MTKAAAQLNISQPGLSKHMVALEKCVGGVLLQRSSTGVTPTPLGRAFLERAYDILHVYDSAMDYMGKMRDSKPLHLRVNALSDCALSDDLLSSVDMELGQCGYSLDLDVQDILPYASLRHPLMGTADLCLCPQSDAARVDVAGVRSARLVTDPLVAVVRNTHRLAQHRKVWMSDMGSDTVWSYYPSLTGGHKSELEGVLRKNGCDPEVVLMPWAGMHGHHANLMRFRSGVHVTYRSIARRITPLSLSDYRIVEFCNDDARKYALYAHYREDTANPAVPLAVCSTGPSSTWEPLGSKTGARWEAPARAEEPEAACRNQERPEETWRNEKGAPRECAAPPSYIPALSCEIRRSGRC